MQQFDIKKPLPHKPLFNPDGDTDVLKRRMIGGNTTNLNDYNNLPIYWYKAIDDKLKLGYYHTLKDVIDKEKGIKTNYLNNHLYYKLK